MSVAILIAARALIAKGWRQHTPGEWTPEQVAQGGQYCIADAIDAVSRHGSQENDAAYERIAAVVGRDPIAFNDDPATTKAEVLAAFDDALGPVSRETK